jgi:hypothetical protein
VSDPRVLNQRDYPSTIHLGPQGRWVRGRVLPDDAVRIDRRTRWGNPYVIGSPDADGRPISREVAVFCYRDWLDGMLLDRPDFLEPLRGKRLACWCAPLPCHGDVILEKLGSELGSDDTGTTDAD